MRKTLLSRFMNMVSAPWILCDSNGAHSGSHLEQYRVQIIRTKLLETLVKRLAKDKTFESASHTLIGLVEYG